MAGAEQDRVRTISPELVLVDPELAEWARASLRASLLEPAEPAEPAGSRDAGASATAASSPARGRRSRLGSSLAAALVASVGVNAVAVHSLLASDPTPTPAARRAASATVFRNEAAQPIPPRAGVAATVVSAPARRPAKSRRQAPPTAVAAGRRPTLRWKKVLHAVYYDVVVWRGHRRIVDLWPVRPTVEPLAAAAAARRRLAPGRYLWFVYPGFGKRRAGRYGALVAHGVLVIGRAPHR